MKCFTFAEFAGTEEVIEMPLPTRAWNKALKAQ